MSRIFGIDLGTTNSLLGYHDKLLTGLVPSVVDLETGSAGITELENMSAVRSFKVDISLFEEGAISRTASARVLRQLVVESKEDVKDVVISVPAYFSDNQRQATIAAATLAGLTVHGLVNEPTAAAIYASRTRKALSLVFDLGGGTFDVSVIDSRLGDYDVQATDGCILGGDDFDMAICKHVIKAGAIKVHRLGGELMAQLRRDCCKAKIAVQKRGSAIMDLTPYGAGEYTLSEDTYVEIMRHVFYPAILKAKSVLCSSIPAGENYDLLFVGGSTRCPYLREWVETELNHKAVDMFYDPDCIVALGASLYAQMVEEGTLEVNVSDVMKALTIGLADGTSRIIIPRNSKIPVEEMIVVYNHSQSDKLMIDLYQGDSFLRKDNEKIGQLIYPYGRVMAPEEGEVHVGIKVEANGVIRFYCKELLKPAVEVIIDRGSHGK